MDNFLDGEDQQQANQPNDLAGGKPLTAPDSRAGGGAPEMGSRLSTLATCGYGVRTSLEATTG